MTEMLPFLIGALVGCVVGVGLMCLMSVSRPDAGDDLVCTRKCLARVGFKPCTQDCNQGRTCTCAVRREFESESV